MGLQSRTTINTMPASNCTLNRCLFASRGEPVEAYGRRPHTVIPIGVGATSWVAMVDMKSTGMTVLAASYQLP